MYLRQSTASQEISIGPFLDSTDGDTEETGLTIANTDVRLKKGSADWASKNSGGGTHEEHGNYRITLDATDTSTVGILEICVHVSGALAVFKTLYVLEEAIYDAFYAASAAGDVALDGTIESGYTLRQSARLWNAILAGKATGGGSTSITFRDINDTKNRCVETVDANGNRSTVTLTTS